MERLTQVGLFMVTTEAVRVKIPKGSSIAVTVVVVLNLELNLNPQPDLNATEVGRERRESLLQSVFL